MIYRRIESPHHVSLLPLTKDKDHLNLILDILRILQHTTSRKFNRVGNSGVLAVTKASVDDSEIRLRVQAHYLFPTPTHGLGKHTLCWFNNETCDETALS